jgi:hypothetical protein
MLKLAATTPGMDMQEIDAEPHRFHMLRVGSA